MATGWKIVAAFIASLSFATLYKVQSQQIMAAGIVGTIGWLINYYLSQYGNDVVAIFAAATAVALSSEIFARIRLQPVPVFLVPGIIPLVPGGQAYQTMLSFLQGNYLAGVEQLVNTLFLAGAIAGGIMLVSSLFRQRKIIQEKET
ncbi:MAG: threonine/serine exporter [Firmicutes bacterium]|nr:threonine/serine exporter [Bacillota bacterium]